MYTVPPSLHLSILGPPQWHEIYSAGRKLEAQLGYLCENKQ